MNTLREHRQRRSLTLEQVGAEVGVDAGNLSRIERGLQAPSLPVAKRLAALYQITLDAVYGAAATQPEEEASANRPIDS